MRPELRAAVWGERRTTLVQVPDGLWEHVKQAVRDRLPRRWRGIVKVRYIDWQAEVFKAYPDLRVKGVRGQRAVLHTSVFNRTLADNYGEGE